jgi:hypothetical protein
MNPSQTELAAFAAIGTELKRYADHEPSTTGPCEEPVAGAMRSEAAMAISGFCRTYRRMRPSIDTVLPSLQSEMPGVADLLRFLMTIADRACRAQSVRP